MAKTVFSYALRTNQPWFHLRGHSWEVEFYGLWDQLRDFLAFVAAQPGVEYVRNRDLLPASR